MIMDTGREIERELETREAIARSKFGNRRTHFACFSCFPCPLVGCVSKIEIIWRPWIQYTRTLLILSYDFDFVVVVRTASIRRSIGVRTRRPVEFASSALLCAHAFSLTENTKFNAYV